MGSSGYAASVPRLRLGRDQRVRVCLREVYPEWGAGVMQATAGATSLAAAAGLVRRAALWVPIEERVWAGCLPILVIAEQWR